MSPTDFEDLVFALVRADDNRAEQLGPPDAGRDTIIRLAGGGELVWQAKHHTSGIDWNKCEDSLKTALKLRDPREVTFVFPVKMTATKEPGLEDLRARYPQVAICKPWTLPDVRDKLADAPDVRRELIDRRIGIDELHVRELVERAAKHEQASEEKTSAAMLGPLVASGHSEALAEAERRAEAGDLRGASERFEALARAVEDRMPAVATALVLQAARIAADDNDRERAGALYLQASRSAAQRGDDIAEFAAFRASWLLPEDERGRSLAAMARASWPERPEEALPVLRVAFERAIEAENAEDILEWATALCDALAAEDDYSAIVQVAKRATPLLESVSDVGTRLDLELERLTAEAEVGGDVEHRWRQLMLSPVGRTPDGGPLIRARWGMALARSGHGDLAAEQFREAAGRWEAAGHAEDEIAEAILSEGLVAQVFGEGRRLDQPGRIAVAELRGRNATAATIADRRETQGLRAWLARRGWDARRFLVLAWGMHRRAGHLAGTLRVAETLHDLFKAGEEWEDALPWAIRAGRQLSTENAAKRVGWASVARSIRPDAPPWERGAMWEAIAAAGSEASDADIADFIDGLLAAAADHDTDERATVQAAPAARRALATFLCRTPEDLRELAVAEVVYETTHTPFPPRRTIEGLILGTDAGVCDQTELIAEVFSYTDRAHLAGFGLAVDLVAASRAARLRAVELAEDHFPALLLCAWADLADEYQKVAARAADVIARSLTGELNGDEILRLDDKGRLARWATTGHQEAIGSDLLDTLASPSEIGAHRYEAGVGLACLAERLKPDVAEKLLERLAANHDQVSVASKEDGMRSHPNPLFARVKMNAPPEVHEVRAVGLRAAIVLAERAALDQQRRHIESRPGGRNRSGPCRSRPTLHRSARRQLTRLHEGRGSARPSPDSRGARQERRARA